MKIQPTTDVLYLKIEEVEAGKFDMTSRVAAVECAEVVAAGDSLKEHYKPGDKVFVKAWAVDTINHNDVRYHFVNVTSGGILAVVK